MDGGRLYHILKNDKGRNVTSSFRPIPLSFVVFTEHLNPWLNLEWTG